MHCSDEIYHYGNSPHQFVRACLPWKKRNSQITMTTQNKETGLCGEQSWFVGFRVQPEPDNEQTKMIISF